MAKKHDGVSEPMTEALSKGWWGNANTRTRKGMSAHQGHSMVFTELTLLRSHYVSLKTNQHRTMTNKIIVSIRKLLIPQGHKSECFSVHKTMSTHEYYEITLTA